MAGYSNLRGPRFERPPFPELENRVKHSVLALFCVLTFFCLNSRVCECGVLLTFVFRFCVFFRYFFYCCFSMDNNPVVNANDAGPAADAAFRDAYMGQTNLAGRVVKVTM